MNILKKMCWRNTKTMSILLHYYFTRTLPVCLFAMRGLLSVLCPQMRCHFEYNSTLSNRISQNKTDLLFIVPTHVCRSGKGSSHAPTVGQISKLCRIFKLNYYVDRDPWWCHMFIQLVFIRLLYNLYSNEIILLVTCSMI